MVPGGGVYIPRSSKFTGSGGGLERELLPANPARVCLLISNPASSPVAVVSAYIVGSDPFKIRITSNSYQEFIWARHGPLPGARWTVVDDLLSDGIYLYELLYVG